MMAAGEKNDALKKEAVRQVSLQDIKFNKENALMAALSCIPIVGAIVFFVEKKDLFVRYFAAQYGLTLLVVPLNFVLGVIPVLGWCMIPIVNLGLFVLVVIGAMKAYKGERYDMPMVSEWALKLMSQF